MLAARTSGVADSVPRPQFSWMNFKTLADSYWVCSTCACDVGRNDQHRNAEAEPTLIIVERAASTWS